MSTSLPVLTTLCPICYTSAPKYRCPRCSMRTCSLECFQTHKIRASCSGIRDPTKYIARRNMTSATIDMDYNFLRTVNKARSEGQEEIRKLVNSQPMTSKRKLAFSKRKKAISEAREKGVDLCVLPSWMGRSRQSKVKWDAKYLPSEGDN